MIRTFAVAAAAAAAALGFRKILGLTVLLTVAFPSAANAVDKIVGMTLFDLIACAGVPNETIEFEQGRTIVTYMNSTTTVSRRQEARVQETQNTCEAIVQIEGETVKDVEYRKSGRLMRRQLVCLPLFRAC